MIFNTVVESNYNYYLTFILRPLQKHIASTENSCIHWIKTVIFTSISMLSQSI